MLDCLHTSNSTECKQRGLKSHNACGGGGHTLLTWGQQDEFKSLLVIIFVQMTSLYKDSTITTKHRLFQIQVGKQFNPVTEAGMGTFSLQHLGRRALSVLYIALSMSHLGLPSVLYYALVLEG